MNEPFDDSPVTSEVLAGNGITFVRVARLIPSSRPNTPTNPATVWRWALKGVKLPNGSIVKLGFTGPDQWAQAFFVFSAVCWLFLNPTWPAVREEGLLR